MELIILSLFVTIWFGANPPSKAFVTFIVIFLIITIVLAIVIGIKEALDK